MSDIASTDFIAACMSIMQAENEDDLSAAAEAINDNKELSVAQAEKLLEALKVRASQMSGEPARIGVKEIVEELFSSAVGATGDPPAGHATRILHAKGVPNPGQGWLPVCPCLRPQSCVPGIRRVNGHRYSRDFRGGLLGACVHRLHGGVDPGTLTTTWILYITLNINVYKKER